MKKLVFSRSLRMIAFVTVLLLAINTSVAFAVAPVITGWNPGDGHIHTIYSKEFLARNSVETMVSAGESEELKWHIITDHSDFAVGGKVWGYLTDEDWTALETDTANTGAFLGEEVTVGNGVDLKTTGHFLAYDIDNRIEPFTSSTRDARRTAQDIVDEVIRQQGGIGCVAHPYTSKVYGPLGERWRAWSVIDDYVYTGRIGIELINDGYQPRPMTLNRWDSYLKKGKKVFGMGNSDAHLASQMGSAYTYVYTGDDLSEKAILTALKKGRAVASNGPFVTFSVTAINGELLTSSKILGDTVGAEVGDVLTLKVDWKSTLEHGYPYQIQLFDDTRILSGTPKPAETFDISTYNMTDSMDIQYTVHGDGYVRVKLITVSPFAGKVAFTNPIFINPPGARGAAQNISVALIIDSSGSMIWNDPQNLRKGAAKFFIDLAQTGDKIAVVDFDYYTRVWEPLREIQNDADRVILKTAVDKVDSSGGTNIGAGLQTGYNQLLLDNSLNKKAAILLTDGVGSYSNQAQLYKDKGWPVYTIALGYSVDISLLQRIASETGGKFYSAPNNTYLSQIYQELSQTLTGGTSVYEESPTILPGQLFERSVVVTPDMLQTTFSISWIGSTIQLTLVQPDSTEITPAIVDLDISHAAGPTYEVYRIDNPMPGEWRMKIQAIDVPPEGETVNIYTSVFIETPPTVSITSPSEDAILSGTVQVLAEASDDEAVDDFTLYIDGEPATTSLDNSTLSYIWDTAASQDGYYHLSAVAIDPKLTFGETDVVVIVDNLLPTADAGPDQAVNVGTEVAFDASGSQDAELFTWDFGDGTEVAAYDYPQAFHTYTQPGVYTVTLTVEDAAGHTATDTAQVTVTSEFLGATVDIDPDVLNLKSAGLWITAYIELPAGYDVNDIDVDSIKLNGVLHIDAAAPATVDDYDLDGIPDLMVKFNRATVASLLSPGNTVELTITGALTSGLSFKGSDIIRVI